MVDPSAQTDGAVTGPPPDIAALIAAHHRAVYRYAYRLTGRQAEAEDLTQQTFLVAQQRLHQLREPERAAAWLFSILRNGYFKARARRQPVAAASLELDVDRIPEEIAVDDIDRQELQAALDELPDDFRLVLVMFYFQEYSYKEIAAELQISIGTVMSRLARAKGRLRQRLLAAEEAHQPRSRVGGSGAAPRTGPAVTTTDQVQPIGRKGRREP
jgi:RNA polymerase sigma-70 factor (ECF subfamily)